MAWQWQLGLRAVLLVGLAVGVAGCEAGLRSQRTDDFTISLSTSSHVRVGNETVTLRVVPRSPEMRGAVQVLLHYYPFVHRVKDSLAFPNEVVRVVPAKLDAAGYHATLELDRPGPWRIAARITQGDRPDTVVYFTIHVEQSSDAAGG